VHAEQDELARRINHDHACPSRLHRWRLDHHRTYDQVLPLLTAYADLIDTTDCSPVTSLGWRHIRL